MCELAQPPTFDLQGCTASAKLGQNGAARDQPITLDGDDTVPATTKAAAFCKSTNKTMDTQIQAVNTTLQDSDDYDDVEATAAADEDDENEKEEEEEDFDVDAKQPDDDDKDEDAQQSEDDLQLGDDDDDDHDHGPRLGSVMLKSEVTMGTATAKILTITHFNFVVETMV